MSEQDPKTAREKFERDVLAPAQERFGEHGSCERSTGERVPPLYDPNDLPDGHFSDKVGYPGSFPYTLVSTLRCIGRGSGP